MASTIETLLGAEAESLLTHTCKGVTADELTLPGPDYIDRVFVHTDRPIPVVRNLAAVHNTGRLAGTGYISILPVDQGIEHSAAASFAKNPAYFDPANLIELALAGGCSAIATTLGGLGAVARRYAHRVPFIVKLNHNDFLHYPDQFDQVMFGTARQAADLGALGVGATIYFGSEQADRQIQEVRAAFAEAHELGMFTVLWCYLRNPVFKTKEADYHVSADLTGQANHIGVTIEADIIKQKQPENNGGYTRPQVRQDRPSRLRAADDRPPRRPRTLAGRELLRRPHRAHQLGGRVQGGRRPGPGRAHRSDQQAGRRHGADRGAQGVPAPHGRRRGAAARRAGRVPRRSGDHRLSGGAPPEWCRSRITSLSIPVPGRPPARSAATMTGASDVAFGSIRALKPCARSATHRSARGRRPSSKEMSRHRVMAVPPEARRIAPSTMKRVGSSSPRRAPVGIGQHRALGVIGRGRHEGWVGDDEVGAAGPQTRAPRR